LPLDGSVEQLTAFLGSSDAKLFPTGDEDRTMMSMIFPEYKGATKSIRLTKAFVRSVKIPKYAISLQRTLDLLPPGLPPVETVYGYTSESCVDTAWYPYMHEAAARKELTIGLLEVCDKMAAGEDEWAWVFEDDVRFCNCVPGQDFTEMLHVPADAELLSPSRGAHHNVYDTRNSTYKLTWGGGLNHALIISKTACRKLQHYTKAYTWRGNSDNDLYRICRGSADIRIGWGGWANNQPLLKRDMVHIPEEEKIHAYALATYICNQVSTPEYGTMAIPAVDIMPPSALATPTSPGLPSALSFADG
jgi:hypothetical protein